MFRLISTQFSETQSSLPSNQSYGQKIPCGVDGAMLQVSQLLQLVSFKSVQLYNSPMSWGASDRINQGKASLLKEKDHKMSEASASFRHVENVFVAVAETQDTDEMPPVLEVPASSKKRSTVCCRLRRIRFNVHFTKVWASASSSSCASWACIAMQSKL